VTASPIGTHIFTLQVHSSSDVPGFGPSLQTYGAQVDQLHADFGGTVDISQVEQALQTKKYKVVTITHVDTSTGADFPLACSTPRPRLL
jgi:cysteine sulfinate desulfinase/cysteine desulfurase-like protein